MEMGLIFLIALLFVVVWLNRGVFGFGRKTCEWSSADRPSDDGSTKWMCRTCGTVTVTQNGDRPPNCR